MADQKRWFKVWGSIVGDPHFGELSLEDIARWTLLGAYVAVHGTNGRLSVPGDARELCHVLRVDSREAAIEALERLPNVHVKRYGTSYPQCPNEEGKNRYGDFSVTLSNWLFYQEDSTARQRMKALRAKRRREVTTETTSTATSSRAPKTPRSARPTRGEPRSAVDSGSSGGEGDPLGQIPAAAVSTGNGHGGPLAGAVGAFMRTLAAKAPLGFIPPPRTEPAR